MTTYRSLWHNHLPVAVATNRQLLSCHVISAGNRLFLPILPGRHRYLAFIPITGSANIWRTCPIEIEPEPTCSQHCFEALITLGNKRLCATAKLSFQLVNSSSSSNGSNSDITYYLTWMMTSSNKNIVRVTGTLCGEFTGHRWIPLTKASCAELWCFFLSVPEPTVEQTSETPVIWDAIALIMASLQCFRFMWLNSVELYK